MDRKEVNLVTITKEKMVAVDTEVVDTTAEVNSRKGEKPHISSTHGSRLLTLIRGLPTHYGLHGISKPTPCLVHTRQLLGPVDQHDNQEFLALTQNKPIVLTYLLLQAMCPLTLKRQCIQCPLMFPMRTGIWTLALHPI